MRRWLKRLLWLGALLLLAGGGWWLLATESGLAWAWGRAAALSGGALAAERVSGRLAGPLHLDALQLTLPGGQLRVRRVDLEWRPWALLAGRLQLQQLQADGIELTLRAGGGAGPVPALAPPLPLVVERLQLSTLTLQRPAADPLQIDAVAGAGRWAGNRLQLEALSARGPWGRLSVAGRLATGPAGSSDLRGDWALQLAERQLVGRGRLGGTFAQPQLQAALSQPFTATLNASAAWRAAPLRWQADVTLPAFQLAALDPAWPALEVAGTAHLEGVDRLFTVAGQGRLREGRVGAWQFNGRLERTASAWQLPRLRLTPDGGAGELLLGGTWPVAAGAATLNAEWQRLQAPVLAAWRSSGSLRLQGRPAAYRGEVTAALARSGLPPAKVSANLDGGTRTLALSAIQGQWLAGRWQGDARFDWSAGLAWQTRLAATDLDPAQLDRRWVGRLGGRVAASGALRAGRQRLAVELLRLQGRLLGHPWQLAAAASGEEGQWQLRQLTLESGDAHLSASGAAGRRWALQLALQAPQLGTLWPGSEGAVSLRGRVDGSGSTPRLRLDGEAEGVAYGVARLAAAVLHTDIDLAGRTPWALGLEIQGLDTVQLHLAQAQLTAGGSAARHEAHLDGRFAGGATITADAHGSWAAGRWRGELGGGRLDVPGLLVWTAVPVHFEWGPEGGELQRWCWQGQGHACLVLQERRGDWQGGLDVAGLPATLFERWLPRHDLALGGLLTLQLSGAASGGVVNRLHARAELHDGSVAYLLPDGRVETALRTAELSADGDGAATRAGFTLALAEGGHAAGTLSLPGWTPGRPLADTQPVQGSLALETAQLEWLTYFVPALLRPRGQLQGELHLGGSAGDPTLTGRIALRGGDVVLPGAGIHLQQLTLDGRSTDGRQLEVNGSARSGPGHLSLQGRLFAERFNRWRLEAALKGENFELVRLVQGRALVSPDLQLAMEQGLVEIRGQLAVPQADINLPRLPDTEQVSPDEVLVNVPEQHAVEPARRWRMQLDLKLVAGDRVRLEGYGFSGRLTGAVTLRGETPGLTQAQGLLNILDGRYEAYGQNLVVQRGRLLFADSPPDNPALDVRAVRPLSQPDLVVGVEVSGWLKEPQLRLFSDPEMDQSEALAWLVLGRPLTSTSRGEADDLYRAAFALGGERAARGIALQFGLDEVSVETGPVTSRTTGTTTTESAVVLGKYLSPRLYLQYAVGLWDTANRLRLRYSLSSHWSVKMEQGEQSGADLLYTIER